MQRLEESVEPIAFKTDDAALPGGASAVLPSDDEGTLGFRVDIRSLAGMQKEALVSRISPAGSAWRLACDEGPYLNGSDLAPFPLGFFAAGLQFSFLTELLRHARREGIRIDALRAVQDTRYSMSGSALRGDMTGGALPVEVQISMEAAAAPDRVAALVSLAESTSPAESIMRDVLANTFALTLNGSPMELAGLRPSPRAGVTDPVEAFDRVRPDRSPGIPPDIITKVSQVQRVHGVEGGVASSLQAEQNRTLHTRATARVLEDGMIETVLSLFKPAGSSFRLLCDARADVEGAGRAPSGLAYLSAGIGFCFMTQLGRYAHIVKHRVRATRVVQFNVFRRSGARWTGAGTADPVDTHVFVDADEPEAAIRQSIVMGEQTCFLHAAMRGQHPTTITLELNGHEVALPGAAGSVAV
ncbi:MAG: OsmC family protein [Acidobacteriota bacterium]